MLFNRNWTWISCIAGRVFTVWAIREANLYWNLILSRLFFCLFVCFFNFTILYWFCHISMNPPQVYICSQSWTLLPPSSSLPVPSFWVIPVLQPQASSIVHRTWTGDSFHIWYTCFNAILPNHPTLSLPHRVQKTVLYISVSFGVSYTGLLLPSF